MRQLIWMHKPEMSLLAGSQQECLREWFRTQGWDIRLIHYYPRLIRGLNQKCDLLVWSFLPAQLDLWSARIYAARQIGVVHELDPRIKSLPQLEHWLVPSRALHEALCRLGIDRARISVTQRLPERESNRFRITNSVGDIRKKLGLAQATRLVFAAGPVSAQAGCQLTVWAMNILKYLHPDMHLLLHGTGGEQERIDAFTHSIGQQQHTHLLPNHFPIEEILQQVNQVWLPRQWDGVPDLLYFALQAGSVIMAADQPSLREWLVHDQNALLLPSDQPPAWASASHKLLTNPLKASRLSKAAKCTPWIQQNKCEACSSSALADLSSSLNAA